MKKAQPTISGIRIRRRGSAAVGSGGGVSLNAMSQRLSRDMIEENDRVGGIPILPRRQGGRHPHPAEAPMARRSRSTSQPSMAGPGPTIHKARHNADARTKS